MAKTEGNYGTLGQILSSILIVFYNVFTVNIFTLSVFIYFQLFFVFPNYKNSNWEQFFVPDEGEWDENEDWEWEEEEEETPAKFNGVRNVDKPVDAEGKANIVITENLVTIDRSKVDWSDDEFEEDEDEEPKSVPPPPPPPPGPPAPPPPPPGPPGRIQITFNHAYFKFKNTFNSKWTQLISFVLSGLDKKASARNERVEKLKKKTDKRPDWNDLMHEIGKYRCPGGLLKKTQCNDRSKPILSGSKVKGVVSFLSIFMILLSV